MTNELQKYTAASIAQITDLKKLGAGIEIAKAAEIFYKAQDAIMEANKAQEMKLRMILQAGTVLMPVEQGGMTPREPYRSGVKQVDDTPTPYQESLDEIGISRQAANTWQRVARVPEPKFEAYLAEVDYTAEGATIAGLLKFAGDWFARSDEEAWGTPLWLFELLRDEFNFTLDVCALPGNAKCPTYFTPEDNGLKQDWNGNCWMNPPYGTAIKDWMAKARQEADNGCLVACLVPARPDTEWWWDNCIASEIRFIKGRLTFEGATGPAPFPSAVIIMRPGDIDGEGKVKWWNIRP